MTTEAATDTGNQNPGEGAPNNDSATTPPQAPAATAQPGSEGEGAAAAVQAGKEGEPGEQPGAPEQYEAFKVAEGFKLEGDRLASAQTLFKELNLTQPQAQRLVDEFTKLAGEDGSAIATALEQQRVQQVEQWGQDTKAELGDKYDETTGLARTAVQAVNDPELTKAFNDLGWGNHPRLVKAFAFFGQFLRDSKVDGLGGGTSDGPAASDHKSVLYGNP